MNIRRKESQTIVVRIFGLHNLWRKKSSIKFEIWRTSLFWRRKRAANSNWNELSSLKIRVPDDLKFLWTRALAASVFIIKSDENAPHFSGIQYQNNAIHVFGSCVKALANMAFKPISAAQIVKVHARNCWELFYSTWGLATYILPMNWVLTSKVYANSNKVQKVNSIPSSRYTVRVWWRNCMILFMNRRHIA